MLSGGDLEPHVSARSQFLIYKPTERVMGGRWALSCACSVKAMMLSGLTRWWDSKTASSVLCVVGSSWMMLLSWSCSPSWSYCFCSLLFCSLQHIWLTSFTRLGLSLPQRYYLCPSFILLCLPSCAQVPMSSACLLFGEATVRLWALVSFSKGLCITRHSK